MNIQITPSALNWFKEECGYSRGDFVRFFARYGGCGSIQSAFSLGLNKEEPKEMGISTQEDGITFYMEQDDVWYLNEKDLVVDYEKEKDDLIFRI
jgi:uncharacterized protein YneR